MDLAGTKPASASPASGAARDALDGARQRIRCQYPGCEADLSTLRRFNLRCKICDEHCKADELPINGLMHRFCQQCNKFHLVEEFDKGKKGCRVKLEKHNKRRRNHRRTNWKDKSASDNDQEGEGGRNAKALRQLLPGYDDYSQYMAVPAGAKSERPNATDSLLHGFQQPASGLMAPKPTDGRSAPRAGQDNLAGQGNNYAGIEAYLAQLSRQPQSASEPAQSPAPPAQMPPLPPGTDIAGLLEAYREGGNRHSGSSSGGANNAAFQQYVLMAAYAAYLAQFPS